MFCRVCGEDNDESSLYCSNDGVALQPSSESFNMASGDVRFCKECGEGVSKSDLYCSNCGSSLYTIEASRGKGIDEVIKETSTSSGKDLKYLFKYSLIGVGIILLISMISSSFINSAFAEMLAEEADFFIDTKLISFLDVSTMLNVSSIKMDLMSGGGSVFNLNLDGIFFIFMLVPILIFTIIGAYGSMDAKKRNKKFGLKEYAFIALSYGIIISILSIFASRKLDFNIPFLNEFTDFGSIEFIKKYSFMATLVKSSLLSLFSLGLGSGVYNFFSGLKAKKFNSLSIASMIFAISSVFALLFIIVANRGDGIFFGAEDIWELGGLFQMFIYALLFINMGTFKFAFEGEKMSASLFENMDQLKEGFDGVPFLYMGLLISMGAFFFHGRVSKKRNKSMKELLYVPAIFAIGLGILAYLTSISLNMTSFMEYAFDSVGMMSFEFNYFTTALGSFVIATLSSLSGYFLTNEASGKVNVNE